MRWFGHQVEALLGRGFRYEADPGHAGDRILMNGALPLVVGEPQSRFLVFKFI